MRSAPRSPCSRRATKCSTPARSCARAPIRNFTWSTNASSAASRRSLSFAQAAALPLTSITAWELLFDRLGAVPGKSVDPRTLLITGGAGGVGSILIQLARRLTGLTVVATATRPESQKWCLDLGAHAVIDHNKPMKEQIEKLKLPPVALVASLTFTDQHYKAIADLMAPQGKFGLIDDPPEFNVSAFKGKAISIHWESMFTRSSFQTAGHDRASTCCSTTSPISSTRACCAPRSTRPSAPSTRPISSARMRCWKAASRAARSCWRGGSYESVGLGKGATSRRAHALPYQFQAPGDPITPDQQGKFPHSVARSSRPSSRVRFRRNRSSVVAWCDRAHRRDPRWSRDSRRL